MFCCSKASSSAAAALLTSAMVSASPARDSTGAVAARMSRERMRAGLRMVSRLQGRDLIEALDPFAFLLDQELGRKYALRQGPALEGAFELGDECAQRHVGTEQRHIGLADDGLAPILLAERSELVLDRLRATIVRRDGEVIRR